MITLPLWKVDRKGRTDWKKRSMGEKAREEVKGRWGEKGAIIF